MKQAAEGEKAESARRASVSVAVMRSLWHAVEWLLTAVHGVMRAPVHAPLWASSTSCVHRARSSARFTMALGAVAPAVDVKRTYSTTGFVTHLFHRGLAMRHSTALFIVHHST